VHRRLPKGVAADEPDHAAAPPRRIGPPIKDRNNGYNHEHAFVKNINRNGLLHENDLLADSFGGKLNPASDCS